MPTIQEVRSQYPQYDDLSDEQLLDGLHKKFYSDMPRADFLAKVGPAPTQEEPAATEQPYTSSILPFRYDEKGNRSFDSNLGILGSIKRGLSLSGEAARGEIDPRSDEGIKRAFEMATIATPVSPAARLTKLAAPNIKPPSAEVLKKVGGEGFEAVRKMGVDYSSDGVRTMAQDVVGKLNEDGILARLAPQTHGILKDLSSPPEGSVAPLTNLIAARKALGKIAGGVSSADPLVRTDAAAAKRTMGRLDEFISGSDPKNVVAGPAADAAKLYKESNANYAAGKRSETLTTKGEAAELQAAAANSGANLDNAIRQRLKPALKESGFSDEELDGIEAIVRGNIGRNTVRRAGNILGGGGGIGSVIAGTVGGSVGASLGGPAGAAAGSIGVPALGMATKGLANNMTKRALDQMARKTRQRSPLYEQMLRDAPRLPIDPKKKVALIRALTASMQAAQSDVPEE